ncbi:MAG: methylenetetrahydrofolate reductase [Bacteroidales bacterium]|jgi:methylenetetrahydrofolate reductase (NADPH)|nr:methylenetetrahydrofolate reductase [Bacteroidales bacterium]
MTITELLTKTKKTAFSFEILPPLKGNSIDKVYSVVDKLRDFNPQYINITTHHSEPVYRSMDNGLIQKVNVRKRPGTVAIAAAIQQRYKIPAVPHIICKGFTKEETEYALIDLNFLGIYNLLLLRGDANKGDAGAENQHLYAVGLQDQVNKFNQGFALDGSSFDKPAVSFSYGVAGYPEKHEEAPNMDSDIYYLKEKVRNGAEYIVTQMFFDNEKYFAFVDRCRKEGITIPIIPGIKPVVLKDQLTVLPKIFRSDIPEALAIELRKCKTDEDAKIVGTEWCIQQCKELVRKEVPSLHFYTLMATESVKQIAKEIY